MTEHSQSNRDRHESEDGDGAPAGAKFRGGTGASGSGDSGSGLVRRIGPGLLLLFILGDILGTGVYALSGEVAGQVGGAAWAPIILAFGVALITAFSYLELVTKYPRAAGAAQYVHTAFNRRTLTFMIMFAVLCSGITSATTSSVALAENLSAGFDLDWGNWSITLAAVVYLALVALLNIYGVGESMKANVVLTCIELTGLLLVILVGFWAAAGGQADFSQAVVFESRGDKGIFLAITGATALAFFSMVGFEDSVNMAEETKDPVRTFPKVLLLGLSTAGGIYVVVSIVSVAIVPIGTLSESTTPLLEVVRVGAPNLPIDQIFPFMTIFAVANTALINMLMASRLVYGMARQRILPAGLGKVHEKRRTPWTAVLFTTALGMGLVITVQNLLGDQTAGALGGTTSLLLLAVFAVVNVSVLVLRRNRPVTDRDYYRAPRLLPYVGAVTTAFLVGPWAQTLINYQIAGVLLLLGVVLAVVMHLVNKRKGIDARAYSTEEDLAP